MAEKTYKFSKEAQRFPKIPEGEYPLKVVSVRPMESSKGGAMLETKFRIQEGDEEGIVLTSFYSLSEGGFWKLNQDMIALELAEDGEELTQAEIIRRLKDTECLGQVITDRKRGWSVIQSVEVVRKPVPLAKPTVAKKPEEEEGLPF